MNPTLTHILAAEHVAELQRAGAQARASDRDDRVRQPHRAWNLSRWLERRRRPGRRLVTSPDPCDT